MLVPSTFTGWYKKMMMNAEMAREMTRSRSQHPSCCLTGGERAESEILESKMMAKTKRSCPRIQNR